MKMLFKQIHRNNLLITLKIQEYENLIDDCFASKVPLNRLNGHNLKYKTKKLKELLTNNKNWLKEAKKTEKQYPLKYQTIWKR